MSRAKTFEVPKAGMHLVVPGYVREKAIKAGVTNFSLFLSTILTAFLTHEPITIRLKDGSLFHFYHGPGGVDMLSDKALDEADMERMIEQLRAA